MKVWAKTKEFSEGKFLVVRRDGTVPEWPHFVLGGTDPNTPAALLEYAKTAEAHGLDPEYVESIRQLSTDFHDMRQNIWNGKRSDPDAAPHRTDDPLVLALMRREITVADLLVVVRAAMERVSGKTSWKPVENAAINILARTGAR